MAAIVLASPGGSPGMTTTRLALVSYQLTPLARFLLSPPVALGRWGSAHQRKSRSLGRSPDSSESAA